MGWFGVRGLGVRVGLRFRLKGLGVRVGLRLRLKGLGVRVGLRLRLKGLGFRVGFWFRLPGLGFRVGLRFRIQGFLCPVAHYTRYTSASVPIWKPCNPESERLLLVMSAALSSMRLSRHFKGLGFRV